MRVFGALTAFLCILVWVGSARAGTETAPLEYSTTTIDDDVLHLHALRGQWVVVNFWATWCKPCRKEMPEFSELHRDRSDVYVIGLAFEEVEPAQVREFLEEYPVSYPIALVDVYEPPAVFGVPRVLPTTLVLSPDGHQVKKFLGPVTRAMLEEFIDASP